MDAQEYATKHERLTQVMQERGVDALWLTNNANIAWISGGNRTYIETSTQTGVASLLITADKRYVLTNNIEGERLRTEEGFTDWEIVAEPWYESATKFKELTQGMRVGADQPLASGVDISSDLVKIRAPLLPQEVERYRMLGLEAGAALGRAAQALEPGMSEFAAAGLVASAAYAIGAVPVVVLVSSDQRFHTIRHPLPTDKPIEKVAMLVLCARRHGLIANLTRIVHFGPVPEEMQRRMAAVGQIDATVIAATRPGKQVSDVFATLQQAYADAGFEGEWRNHHQGGACSYGSRDFVANPSIDEVVKPNQAYAWNPSVPGAKSEDTVLITDDGFEVLTPSPDWPMQTFEAGGQRIQRHTVLEL